MTPRRQRIHLFRSCEDGPPHINRESVLVEVPGKWAYSVVSLIHVSQEYRQAGLMVTNIGLVVRERGPGWLRGMCCCDMRVKTKRHRYSSLQTRGEVLKYVDS
jgi:hypothetical protein